MEIVPELWGSFPMMFECNDVTYFVLSANGTFMNEGTILF